jgi:hypothetical protein
MSALEEKLHNRLVAILEENIQLDQRLLAKEENEYRKKTIQDVLAVLNEKLAKAKT